MSASKNTNLYLVALLCFTLGVGYLLFTGFSEGAVYFKDVSEALEMPREDLRAARLFGIVQEENIEPLAGELGVRFLMADQHKPSSAMWILYRGAVPDAFKPGAEVIVEGGFTPGKEDFQARTLITKCPSKYQKEHRE